MTVIIVRRKLAGGAKGGSDAATEAAITSRRGHEDVARLPAAELRSLQETAYLLRSPRNAARLHAALEQSRRGAGEGEQDEASDAPATR